MANLFKQSRDKQKKSATQGVKKRTSANAQVAGLRFKKSSTSEKQLDAKTQDLDIKSGHVSNQHRVSIDALDWMGQGVARGNPVIFVEGALPNETCEIEITASKKQVANARVSRVINASSDRVTPFCPVFELCGGC
ncbi:MAG: TRAM domain-containing protein, partial [Pseudomonadota bacterium]|nr:TRAM domain-containing protein [Pseudomonadota bacterium]